MRGRTIGMILLYSVFAGEQFVRADGPQFTGLFNIYRNSAIRFMETSNALALMDKDGPIFGSVVTAPGDWRAVAVAPGGATFYTTTSGYVKKWDASTGVGTPLPEPSVGGDVPGWEIGATWDTARNRLVVASIGGIGYFYNYVEASNQWNVISTLDQVDLRSIAYRSSNDLIYALPNLYQEPITEILTYNPATGQQVGALSLPEPIPPEESGTDLFWQMTLASDGQLAVIVPRFVPRPGGGTTTWNWLYLINPDTGVMSYSAPLPLPPQWNVNSDGSWNASGNWSTNTVPQTSVEVDLLGVSTAPHTITLDGNHTVSILRFDNAKSYTIAPGSGGTLTIGDGTFGNIIVFIGTHEISAGVTFAGNVMKSGLGALTISGPQNHGPGAALNIIGGRVTLNSNAGTPGSAVGSNLSVHLGGASSNIILGSNQDLKALTISIGDDYYQTFDLASPADEGAFHSVNIYAADLDATKAALSAAIRNANAAGAPDFRDGIVDTGLHAGAGIGIAIIDDHVTIRSTRVGDLNLDGSVTIADFIGLASNFDATSKTWQEGDLNYDGKVTIADFIDLAANFGATYDGGFGPANASDLQMLSDFASSIGADPSIIGSAVPEPAALSLLAVGVTGLLKRRRQAGCSAGCSSGR